MNAGRKYLGSGNLSGKVFVTAGLGGMSGAQAKAAVVAGCVGVIAEVRREGERWEGERPRSRQLGVCGSQGGR